MILYIGARICNDYAIGVWAHNENGDQQTRYWFYTMICLTCAFLVGFAIYLRSASC